MKTIDGLKLSSCNFNETLTHFGQQWPVVNWLSHFFIFKVSPNGKDRDQSSESSVNLIRLKFSRSFFSGRPLFLFTR